MNRRALLVLSARAGVGSMASHLLASLSFARDLDNTGHRSTMRALARPSADQIEWQDLEIGMFIHFGPETWRNGRPDDVATPVSEMNTARLDTDEWARTAIDLGAKYIVFVAKHRFGFCWWQTDTTDYSVETIPWKNGHGDVLRNVSESCRKFGLRLGVYVSPRDDHLGAATGGICKTPEEQRKYNTLYRQQVKEVLSRYGSLIEIWFDGSVATPVGDLISTYQPHARSSRVRRRRSDGSVTRMDSRLIRAGTESMRQMRRPGQQRHSIAIPTEVSGCRMRWMYRFAGPTGSGSRTTPIRCFRRISFFRFITDPWVGEHSS